MREASDDLQDRANRRGAAGHGRGASTARRGRKARRRLKAVAADPEDAAYWLRNREGWFWYRDPPAAARRPAPPAPKPPRELVEFEAMQKRLEDLKRVAVMNPTDANLTAYMRYQRMVMNKSEHFAERWQRLVWTVPDLDYGLSGRPTNAMAINVFDEQQRERQAQTIKTLAATHGSSSCSAATARIATASRRS